MKMQMIPFTYSELLSCKDRINYFDTHELPKDYGYVDAEINGKKITIENGDLKLLDKWLKTFNRKGAK